MPKKKTGARKKAEKQKERQKDIKNNSEMRSLVQRPCNMLIVRKLSYYAIKLEVFHLFFRNVINVRGI
jgi:hypothetical protein